METHYSMLAARFQIKTLRCEVMRRLAMHSGTTRGGAWRCKTHYPMLAAHFPVEDRNVALRCGARERRAVGATKVFPGWSSLLIGSGSRVYGAVDINFA
jgi:hypothetical protein